MEAIIGGRRFEWGRQVYVMGIVNVTPDSFSGDGRVDPEAAAKRAFELAAAGADIIDVGGESTRPGHQPVSTGEELARVLPVLERLAGRLPVPISIDTWKAPVAAAALDRGAAMVNDVWGLQRSPEIAGLAAAKGAALVLMHNQADTHYRDLVPDVKRMLATGMARALSVGVPRARVILDPGIGFGKTADQNLEVLRRLFELRSLGQPLLVGTSRKSFLGRLTGARQPADRQFATAASVAAAVLRGAEMVRVHDVAAMREVAQVALALR